MRCTRDNTVKNLFRYHCPIHKHPSIGVPKACRFKKRDLALTEWMYLVFHLYAWGDNAATANVKIKHLGIDISYKTV